MKRQTLITSFIEDISRACTEASEQTLRQRTCRDCNSVKLKSFLGQKNMLKTTGDKDGKTF